MLIMLHKNYEVLMEILKRSDETAARELWANHQQLRFIYPPPFMEE